jgi:ATP-dependent exoDNAse (exonuclease V) beta subunit
VFARAAEALNTFYVACTRPRYGLIIDITSDAKLDKPESSVFRIPIRTAVLLNKDSFPFDPESYSLQITEEDGILLKFQLGKVGIPLSLSGERQSMPGDVGTGRGIRMENHSFKPQETELSVMQRTGILVHRILEKTSLENQWEALLKLENDSGFWKEEEITQAQADLSSLFEIPEVRTWFSGDWKSYPEQSLISSEGRLLRADRILIQENRAVILDFKTGEFSTSHLQQMKEYIRVFEEASRIKTEGWLINSHEKNIRKVEAV